MKIRIASLLLILLTVVAISACKKEKKEVWTLKRMAGTQQVALFKFDLKPLEPIVGRQEFDPEDNGLLQSVPMSLTLGNDEKEITLRVEREGLKLFEVRLKQVETLKDGTVLFELVENPSYLIFPPDISEEYDVTVTVTPTKTYPETGGGRYSAQFSPEEHSVLAKFRLEILYSPKPGKGAHKQHYGGDLIYWLRK